MTMIAYAFNFLAILPGSLKNTAIISECDEITYLVWMHEYLCCNVHKIWIKFTKNLQPILSCCRWDISTQRIKLKPKVSWIFVTIYKVMIQLWFEKLLPSESISCFGTVSLHHKWNRARNCLTSCRMA